MTVARELNDEVFERENAEAARLAIDALNAHARAGGTVHEVSWKDEGGVGPVYVRLVPDSGEAERGMAFDEVCDACGYYEALHTRAKQREGMLALQWMSRGEARRLAKHFAAPLVEW